MPHLSWGLDPHNQPGLFWLPGGHIDRALKAETPDAFRLGVETYRRCIAPMFEALYGVS